MNNCSWYTDTPTELKDDTTAKTIAMVGMTFPPLLLSKSPGKFIENLSVWTQKLAEAALVNPNNLWGQLSFPALGILQSARGFLVIHKTRGFICFLKTFTKLTDKMNVKTYKNDDNG